MALKEWLINILYSLMPNLLKPTSIVKHFTTETVQGEVTVNLNITLTLCVDQSGELSLKVEPSKKVVDDSPDYIAQIPDWGTVDQEDLIKFGQDVD